ncbi:hypothetical protein F5146DRAFT_935475, partial [Armillaria mellea]
HLLLLMHGGKGNEQESMSNIDPGELAIECLACLHSGVNLSEDWCEASNSLKCILSDCFSVL